MKKAFIFLLTGIMLSGCSNAAKNEGQLAPASATPQPTEQEEASPSVCPPGLEDIAISGVISEIGQDMITLTNVEGDTCEKVIKVLFSGSTLWDVPSSMVAQGHYMTVQVSPAMTRSIPPQTSASRVMSINPVVMGEVTAVDENRIVLTPISGFNSNQPIVLLLSDDTEWKVEQGSISVGHYIRVIVSTMMTASLPPQVNCIGILSIETRD